MPLLVTIVQPTILYEFEVWQLGLLELIWASTDQVQIFLLQQIIGMQTRSPSTDHPCKVWDLTFLA